MDKSLSQSLQSLIPSFPLPLPVSLLDLSTSLLAQSRIQARSLKTDEEIARAYACAHLACERLKTSLTLPKIQPRPPCPPRVYQKLYRYFGSILLTASPRRSGRTHAENRNKEAPVTSLRTATSKSETPVQQSKSYTDTNNNSNGNSNISTDKLRRLPSRRVAATAAENRKEAEQEEDLVPQWVMPAIRVLCDKLGASAAPPHIYAGVSSILSLAVKAAPLPVHTPRISVTRIPALIVAIGLIVYACLSGKETPPEKYARQKAQGLDSLGDCVPSARITKSRVKEDEPMDVDTGDSEKFDSPADVDHWLREIRDRAWMQLDWFKNVRQGSGLNMDDKGDDVEDQEPHDDKDGEVAENESWNVRRGLENGVEDKGYLQPGLGTMMQDQLDYLSEGRRADYQIWKRDMMVRIKELERERKTDMVEG